MKLLLGIAVAGSALLGAGPRHLECRTNDAAHIRTCWHKVERHMTFQCRRTGRWLICTQIR